MAVRPPDRPDGGDKAPSKSPSTPRRAVPNKPGQPVQGHGEHDEHTHEPDARQLNSQQVPPQKQERSAAPKEAERQRQKHPGGGGSGSGGQQQPKQMKAGELAPPGRIDVARSKGFAQTPSIGDFVSGQQAPKAGASFAEMLPGSRVQRSDLPEPTMRPPVFLSVFEGMKDIYLRSRGRASPKTRELLEGPQLEDLVKMLLELQENEAALRNSEARLNKAMMSKLGADTGPLLVGLNDPRLSEPWRLFLDGWDIWVTEGEGEGIELFWEGEAEDDDGEALPLLQALRLKNGEITLEAKIGAQNDRITFDGQVFYRLKSDSAKK